MIRLTLILIFLALFGIISIPIYFVLFIIGKFNMRKKAAISQKIVAGALKFVMFIAGTKLDVEGIQNIDKDEAVLYVCNHRSYFDIVVTYATVPTLTGYISKDDIKKIPVVSNWMKRLNCLFLDRNDVRQGLQVILTAIEKVKEGYSMFIMPEGKRNHSDELLEFKDAVFKIALKSGCKVVPVAVAGTDDVFENCFPRIRSGKIKLRYGKPVDLADLSKEEKKHIGEYFREIIKSMLDDMK